MSGVQEGQGSPVDELDRDVQLLREKLSAAETEALGHQATLAELEDKQTETAGRLALANGQAADLTQRLKVREADLKEAQQQTLYDAFLGALADRDAAASDAAVRIVAAAEALAELDEWRREVEQTLEQVPKRFKAGVPDEPQEFQEAWERLIAAVRSKLDLQLEDELLEAAAQSHMGFAIPKLPAHLQEAARQRRRRATAARDAAPPSSESS